MTFALSSAISMCRNQDPIGPKKAGLVTTIVLDCGLVGGAAFFAAIILAGVFTINPQGVGSIGNYLVWGSTGVAGGIITADILAAVIRSCRQKAEPRPPTEKQKGLIKKFILEHQKLPSDVTPSENSESRKVYSHQILPNFFIGDKFAFLETTGLTYTKPDTNTTNPPAIQATNPNEIQIVISACSVVTILADCGNDRLIKKFGQEDGMGGVTDLVDDSAFAFEKKGIEWCNLGQIFDSEEHSNWCLLVDKCTTYNPTSPPVLAFQSDQADDILAKATEKYENSNVEALFEPVFQRIDQGVFYEKKVLLHCTQGRSRSVAIAAAYLINRFGVTTEQALAFLRCQRPCIGTYFEAGLKDYEQKLCEARAAKRNS